MDRWLQKATAVLLAGAIVWTGGCSTPTALPDPPNTQTTNETDVQRGPTPAPVHTTLPKAPSQPMPALVGDRLTRDTGMDMQACWRFTVCGTDLGQPFLLQNGSVGYLFGDTFAVKGPYMTRGLPPGTDKWRSPVMLRSNVFPKIGQPIEFDSAAGLAGDGVAPEFIRNYHRSNGEITILTNDGITLPNGDIIVSFMSINAWTDGEAAGWQTRYAGLAISHDGNQFERLDAPIWRNGHYDAQQDRTEYCDVVSSWCNTDPFQMWSMQLGDDGYVYIITVRAGRQQGPMMMLRVPWDQMLDQSKYTCWNGDGWGGKCQPILDQEAPFGEPSLRKLRDGVWAMSYTAYGQALTRVASSPQGPWSEPKFQMSHLDLNSLYGIFIHPYSTSDYLILMVSSWQTKGESKDLEDRELLRYDVSHLITTTQ